MKQKISKLPVIIISSFVLFVLISGITTAFAATSSSSSGFAPTATTADLQAKYQNALTTGKKVHILVMPGHEPGYGGTEYKTLKEREIAVDISNKLAELLRQNPRFQVTVARSNDAWTPVLSNYFAQDWTNIQDFVTKKKAEMAKMVGNGSVQIRDFSVDHNTAATDVALRLYGINKWSNENNVDIAIHVHLNDNPDHTADAAGNHSGFAVYIPDPQFGNGATSKDVGTALAYELNRLNATSTLPIENYGVVPDQDLIALGSNNTANYASVLIEYGYVYESKITEPIIRKTALDDYAYATYLGLQDYFKAPLKTAPTLTLPRTWSSTPTKDVASADAYALQAALRTLGFYPAGDETLFDCPVNGMMGTCTVNAVKAYQKSKGFAETGILDTKTLAALNLAVKPAAPTTCALVGLKAGSTGANVTKLQTVLAKDATLYPGGLITGYFGPATEAAVKKFQASKGIVSSGTAATTGYGAVGPRTGALLCAL